MTEEAQQLSSTDLVIDDLTRRVAATTLEVTQWRARAIIAEQALAEISDSEEAETKE